MTENPVTPTPGASANMWSSIAQSAASVFQIGVTNLSPKVRENNLAIAEANARAAEAQAAAADAQKPVDTTKTLIAVGVIVVVIILIALFAKRS